MPFTDVRRCIHDSLDTLLDNLVGDERNVLLTLARMIVTLRIGRIVPKDEAAEDVLPALDAPLRPVLSLAARAYVGEAYDEWADLRPEASATATALAGMIRAEGSDTRRRE